MYFAWFIQDRGYVQYLFVLLTTKYHRTTLPRIPGEVDTEERGYIYMQITMEAVFAVLLAGMGVVRIFSWDCRIIPQSNSPMPVLPTMQSDDVRQENMATVNTA